jgi:AcrR family transcriptional regulator
VPPPTSGPVRAHALRNREHILQVASEAFAESGTTSLNAIAKRAGSARARCTGTSRPART